MRFRILGPLEVLGDDHDLTPAAPKQRAVLALLLLRRNRLVQTTTFVEELWGADPPTSASQTLQTYIYKLRKMIRVERPGEGSKLLRTSGSGYLLAVRENQLDLDRFDERAGEGARLLAAGAPGLAHTALTEALALWQGAALANVCTGTLLAADAARLEELRLRTLELRIDADLQLGQHRGLVGELTSLTMLHPLNETFHAKLMMALALSGRPNDALDAYRRLHRSLRDELALDPSTELRMLHQSILASRPMPVPRLRIVARPSEAPLRAASPAQLPPDVADFAGHGRLVEGVRGRLAGGEAVALTGMPGVGKTALAVHAAHGLRDRFADGQLYVDLRGTAAVPASPHEVLTAFLRAAGVLSAEASQMDLDTAAATFRAWCAERRVLVVLDDAASAPQVAPLVPGSPRCGLLVTSRLVHVLPGAAADRVPSLPVQDGLRLLADVIGAGRVNAEPDSAAEIVRLAGRLPLAVRGAAARLAAAPGSSLARFARQIDSSRTRLADLSVGEFDIRSRYAASYQKLVEEQRWAFRLLGLVGDRGFEAPDVAALLGCPPSKVEAMLIPLVECHLLRRDAGHRYAFSGLAHVYATECLADLVGRSAVG